MGRRAHVRVGAIGLVMLAATVAVLGAVHLCRQFEVGKRVNHWIVWSGTERSPICEGDRVVMALPEGASKLSGVIHYDHGAIRAPGARDLPLQAVMLTASGLTLTVEDAYRSTAEDTHRAALPPQTRSKVLLVRIVAGYEDDGESTLAYRYFHYGPGEPITLTLPYEIDIVKLPEDLERGSCYSYRASLGPLHAEGEREVLNDDDWDDIAEDPSYLDDYRKQAARVYLEMSMDSGVAGVRYAEVTVLCDGIELQPEAYSPRHPMWRINTDGGILTCEATATGMISYTPEWKPVLASSSVHFAPSLRGAKPRK